MEVLVAKQRLSVEISDLIDLQRALLNVNRFDERWLAERQWQVMHSEDNNFIDEDVVKFIEFCDLHGMADLIATETLSIFMSTGLLDVRSFPSNATALSQVLYGLGHPLNSTHEDAGWILDAAVGVNLILNFKRPWQFLILRDGGGVVSIAGSKSFIEHMTTGSELVWLPGLPPWVRPQF